ncbi:hypothetical protein RSAG8_13775, partial [Rhizoctonia solani AG-8 WAC10335]
MVVTGGFGPFHRCVLESLFSYNDSILKKLVFHSGGEHLDAFIVPFSFELGDLDREFNNFALNLTERQIGRGFSTINTLHTHGIFPSWSSIAYHGLVDLRLLSTSYWSNTKEAQIISVLNSSPGLRIIHFGLQIQDSDPDVKHVPPVYLQDLQVYTSTIGPRSKTSSTIP